MLLMLLFILVLHCVPLPMAASAWGVAKLWITMIETVGRNPQVKKDVDTYGWAGFAAVEAIALYCLVVALIMLNK